MRPALAAVVALLLAVAVAAPASAQAPPVATVDGIGEVTRAQFDHWALIAARAERLRRVPPPGTPAFRRIRRQVVELLVQSLWVRGEAQERGIVVTAEEVRRAVAKQRRQAFPRPGDFGRFLRRSGYTIADIHLRVRLQLTSDRIRREVVRDAPPVTPEEVRAYYDERARHFVVPERRRVRMIVARTRASASRARRLIAHGASFARAARLTGARAASATSADLPRRLRRAVLRAPRARLRGPVRAAGRWHVFRVTAIRPARRQPFEEVEATIRDILESERQQQALTVFIDDFRSRWRAATACQSRFAADDLCGRTLP